MLSEQCEQGITLWKQIIVRCVGVWFAILSVAWETVAALCYATVAILLSTNKTESQRVTETEREWRKDFSSLIYPVHSADTANHYTSMRTILNNLENDNFIHSFIHSNYWSKQHGCMGMQWKSGQDRRILPVLTLSSLHLFLSSL